MAPFDRVRRAEAGIGFLGQDTEAVRVCADSFLRGGSAIAQLVAEITPRVMDESSWRGKDAGQLRSAWQSGVLHDVDKSGNLVPSNSITPDQAGHPDSDAAPMPGHPQERQTS